MAWEPWIKIVDDSAGDQAVQDVCRRARDPQTGLVSDLVRLNAASPAVAGLLLDLNREIHRAASGLTRREQEVAALVVSAFNGCVH